MKGDTFRLNGGSALAVIGADETARAAHVACFADEVVIDFPSVAPAVERMRHAFVDGDRATLVSACVTLSLREAAIGARLPLDVPIHVTCRDCGGRGETWADPCARCGASGAEIRTHQVLVCVPPGVVDGTRYRFNVATRHDPPTRVELHVTVQLGPEAQPPGA